MIEKYIKYCILCCLNALLLTSCGINPNINNKNNNSFYTYKSQTLHTNTIVFYDSTAFQCMSCVSSPINYSKPYALTTNDLREIDYLLYELFYTNKYQVRLLPLNLRKLLLQYHAYYNNEQEIVINIALLDRRYYHNKGHLLNTHQYYDKMFRTDGYIPKPRKHYIMWNLNITLKEISHSQMKHEDVRLLIIYK